MARKKLERFNEFAALPNTFEFTKDMKGKWRSVYFKNENPLVLELGCGKGEYAIGLGTHYHAKNVIGIDIQGERLWYGANIGVDNDLKNVAFLRAYIDHLPEYFAEGEVDEIWITFPDPYKKTRNKKKRLTSKRFLARYQKILKPLSPLHLKTDNEMLFDYSLEEIQRLGGEIINEKRDIKLEALPEHDILRVQTTFEKKYRERGLPIFYCKFTLPKIDV